MQSRPDGATLHVVWPLGAPISDRAGCKVGPLVQRCTCWRSVAPAGTANGADLAAIAPRAGAKSLVAQALGQAHRVEGGADLHVVVEVREHVVARVAPGADQRSPVVERFGRVPR